MRRLEGTLTERNRHLVDNAYIKSVLGTAVPASWKEKTKKNLVPPSDLWAPKALTEYLTKISATSPLNTAHNRFVPIKDLHCIGDYVVFLQENQGGFHWGYDKRKRKDDPTVYVCNVSRKKKGKKWVETHEWFSEKMKCSAFLRAMLCWQIVLGGFSHCGTVESTRRLSATIKREFPRLARGGGLEFYGSKGIVIGRAGPSDFYFAARTGRLFKELQDRLLGYGLERV